MDKPDLKVKFIETETDVPDNNYAKIMYYLHCVYTVAQNKSVFNGMEKYLDCKNYYLLSKEDKEIVMGLAIMFKPDVMKSQSLFIPWPGDNHPEDRSNQIIELTALNFKPEAPKIVGRSMYYTESWLEYYYYAPSVEIVNERIRKKNDCCECLFENSCCNCFESCFNCICNRGNLCEGKCSRKCKKIGGMIIVLFVLGAIIAFIAINVVKK